MAYIEKAIEELMDRFPDPVDITPLLDFDDIDESLNLMEKCLELHDAAVESLIYESQYACAKALEFKGEKLEKFKGMAKKILLKIIEYVKQAVKCAISIITWPSRMICRILTRYKKIDIAIGLRHGGIEIATPLESMSKSMDLVKKQKEKIDSEYIFDLDEIIKYIKRCEEWADLHYKQDFTVGGKSVSLDNVTKAISEALEKRSRIIQSNKILLHNAIMKETEAHPISIKTKKILDILNNVTESLKDTLKLASSAQKEESILHNVLDRLTSLEKKIEECTYEVMNTMKEEERESIYHTLSLIRAYVTDFAYMNIDISKYFRNIDNEIEKINIIARFAHKSFTGDMVAETIDDVKVIVDDLFVCHDEFTKFIASEKKRDIFKTGDSSYHSSRKDLS